MLERWVGEMTPCRLLGPEGCRARTDERWVSGQMCAGELECLVSDDDAGPGSNARSQLAIPVKARTLLAGI